MNVKFHNKNMKKQNLTIPTFFWSKCQIFLSCFPSCFQLWQVYRKLCSSKERFVRFTHLRRWSCWFWTPLGAGRVLFAGIPIWSSFQLQGWWLWPDRWCLCIRLSLREEREFCLCCWWVGECNRNFLVTGRLVWICDGQWWSPFFRKKPLILVHGRRTRGKCHRFRIWEIREFQRTVCNTFFWVREQARQQF